MEAASPPHGWFPADRAPALRRQADRLEALADGHKFPARVRRLARDLRLRATEIECGRDLAEEASQALRVGAKPDLSADDWRGLMSG